MSPSITHSNGQEFFIAIVTEFLGFFEENKMARITEDLIRKCAEHNECEIFSLEELSLHQRNIIKLEHLDRWCRDLKILYLHNNLISKIENLGRLKKLEYINFTLNNITRIENLEGCESLKKLDFTVNFIGDLTSVESLKENSHLEELYLTGNPCVDYEGYREFVLAALPQLKILDGENIKPSQRISALQKYYSVRRDILEQQSRYMKKIGKTDEEIRTLTESLDKQDELDEPSKTQDNFWKQPASNTPQTRIEIYKQLEKSRYKDKKSEEKKLTRPKRLFADDGRPLNINEPKLEFEFTNEEENNCYKLDLGVYRFLSTCSIDVDVQPNYVRVLVKGKVFQLHLPKEVKIDSCTSLRSQVTGHLLITMPKVEEVLKSKIVVRKKNEVMKNQSSKKENNTKLEVTSGLMQSLSSIVIKSNNDETREKNVVSDEMPAEEFAEMFDDSEIPPLI